MNQPATISELKRMITVSEAIIRLESIDLDNLQKALKEAEAPKLGHVDMLFCTSKDSKSAIRYEG